VLPREGTLRATASTRKRFSSHEPSSTKRGKVEEIAGKAVVQLRAELRAVAALNNVELITALISFNWQLALVGLQLRILNGEATANAMMLVRVMAYSR
jgi:hypothetical protein